MEYKFRPLRYYLSATSKMMSKVASRVGKKGTRSKFVVVIPIERDSSFWLLNNYVFVLLCQVLSFSTFALDMPDSGGDVLGITLALYFLLVAYKFELMSGLPRLAYFTHFDTYLSIVFALLFLQYFAQSLCLILWDSEENMSGAWEWVFYGCLLQSFLTHVWVAFKGSFMWKNQTRELTRLGKTDPKVMDMYARHGIRLSKKVW